ncbi:MAG: 3-keto-5-aminohexanoate cleavage enzyme [Symbiobacteriia bacterium]
MEKLIITAALVGAEVTRKETPNIPLTPEEIATAAAAACQAGASIIHLHVRDKAGEPTQSTAVFEEVTKRIRERCDVIVQFSTGGATSAAVAERLQPLALNPEMATLTTGTVNFGDSVFMNTPAAILAFAGELKARGIKPEIEVFDTGMIASALRLAKQGLLTPPLHFDLVMGVPGGIPGTPKDLLHLVESLPAGATWGVAGIGRSELPLGAMAILMGGHVRVGFEDNIYYSRGVLAESNAQLVERMARLAAEFGREVARPDEARAILGMAPRA